MAALAINMLRPSGSGPSNPGTVVTMSAPATPSTDKYLLLATTIFFALVLIAIDKLFPNEGRVFQVIANLTSGFAGAFFHALSPSTSNGPSAPAR